MLPWRLLQGRDVTFFSNSPERMFVFPGPISLGAYIYNVSSEMHLPVKGTSSTKGNFLIVRQCRMESTNFTSGRL